MIKSIVKRMWTILNAFVRRSKWFNESLFPDCRKFIKHSTFGLKIVNLGSTSALHAFSYDDINVKAANWALGHNPLACDEAVLKNYVSFLKPEEAVVIIPLCAFSSLSGSYDYFEDRYYSILYPSTIPNFSKRKHDEVMEKYRNPLIYYPLYSMLSDGWYEIRNLFTKKYKILTEEEMGKDAQRWIDSWLVEFGVDDFTLSLSLVNQDAIDDAALYINRMITLCKEHNVTLVMVIPPMYHTLAEKFTAQARKVLLDTMLAKVADQSVRFINYMDDENFTNDRTLFKDSLLLNKMGAKKFTAKFLKEIGFL